MLNHYYVVIQEQQIMALSLGLALFFHFTWLIFKQNLSFPCRDTLACMWSELPKAKEKGHPTTLGNPPRVKGWYVKVDIKRSLHKTG